MRRALNESDEIRNVKSRTASSPMHTRPGSLRRRHRQARPNTSTHSASTQTTTQSSQPHLRSRGRHPIPVCPSPSSVRTSASSSSAAMTPPSPPTRPTRASQLCSSSMTMQRTSPLNTTASRSTSADSACCLPEFQDRYLDNIISVLCVHKRLEVSTATLSASPYSSLSNRHFRSLISRRALMPHRDCRDKHQRNSALMLSATASATNT